MMHFMLLHPASYLSDMLGVNLVVVMVPPHRIRRPVVVNTLGSKPRATGKLIQAGHPMPGTELLV
jgi:hypothetical protein